MLLRHLLRPLDPTSLLLIAVFTVGFLIGMMGGFPGMVLSLLLFSWLFKYAYILLDSVANGVQETPVLSLEMLNPFAGAGTRENRHRRRARRRHSRARAGHCAGHRR